MCHFYSKQSEIRNKVKKNTKKISIPTTIITFITQRKQRFMCVYYVNVLWIDCYQQKNTHFIEFALINRQIKTNNQTE